MAIRRFREAPIVEAMQVPRPSNTAAAAELGRWMQLYGIPFYILEAADGWSIDPTTTNTWQTIPLGHWLVYRSSGAVDVYAPAAFAERFTEILP